MSTEGTKWHRNITKNLSQLSRAHERYRLQIDGFATTYSEREYAFVPYYIPGRNTGD